MEQEQYTFTRRRPKRKKKRPEAFLLAALTVFLCVIVFGNIRLARQAETEPETGETQELAVQETPTPKKQKQKEKKAAEAVEVEAEPEETPEVVTLYEFEPSCAESTQPSNFMSSTGIMVDGEMVDAYSYQSEETIDFGFPEDYTELEGIITFRGNNFRDSAAYGTAALTEKTLSESWSIQSGALSAPDGECWTGSGWTGQPLIVTWPKETRQHMNMYDWAKEQESLTEVIYATMGGTIYFLDLASGERTRDDLYLGYTFKGAGALDPRGYPILYVGSGYNSYNGTSHVFIISLIDFSILYEFGAADSFSLRGSLSFFDSSPLVDAETDTLIYPGESGILYLIHLNSSYDAASGTLRVEPNRTVKWRYASYRASTGMYWYGMEDSAIIWRGHLIVSDNGGNLMCLDLNTLQLKWVHDTLDDTNCTPVLELEDGHPYVYTSTSFRAGWRAPQGSKVPIPIWKIDALTGEVVWQTEYSCGTISGTSGGVQGTLAMGKNSLSDLIFVPVAMTHDGSAGTLSALNKHTGEIVWEFKSAVYAWSSPVAVYDAEGNGYIIYCTCGGTMYLLDGLTGEVLASLDLGSNIEASPAVYNDTVVVGTRGQRIYGIKLN